ncbi:hypothetical protein AXG93_3873s1370 [Marchantia polymorpha subsp. ruderalis]|uniref:Uncharacterized protein n=1 Tax=Marchantia polymorpha subsp. ruderalis TaxID=1480154 RepID=A0A176VI10_MARPO|nr:hypothetical protein AXG93_3873s1370 [Marchantia polymorpha subsp. ruderalis]
MDLSGSDAGEALEIADREIDPYRSRRYDLLILTTDSTNPMFDNAKCEVLRAQSIKKDQERQRIIMQPPAVPN